MPSISIGIICGKFKPPHAGHVEAIKKIAKENDETHVFVSPIEVSGITGKKATLILKEYISQAGLEDHFIKLHACKSSPVKAVYEFISDLGKTNRASEIEVNLYSLAEDMHRFSNIEKFAGGILTINRINTKRINNVSGTKMRKAIRDKDQRAFKQSLPSGTDHKKMWSLITEEPTGSYSIPADSFFPKDSTDPNVQSTDISVQMGAIPNFWTNSAPYSRWDLNPSNNITQIRRNPIDKSSQNRAKTFTEYLENEENK